MTIIHYTYEKHEMYTVFATIESDKDVKTTLNLLLQKCERENRKNVQISQIIF